MLMASSLPDFVTLATKVTEKESYQVFSSYMNDVEMIKHIFLNECQKSDELLFASCEILGKKILNGDIMKSTEDLETISNQKTGCLDEIMFIVSSKLYEIVNNQSQRKLQPFIVRSILNSISLCMFAVIKSRNTFNEVVLKFVSMLAPDFSFNKDFISSIDNSLYFVEMSQTPLGYHHQYVSNILSNLIDYFVNGAYFENYYTFRRTLNAFRNNYSAYIVNYTLYCFKTTYAKFAQVLNPEQFIAEIKPFLRLLEQSVTFPCSLNMHEYEIEDEVHENISGLQAEIYFPSYFRNVLCDTTFLLDLMNLYSFIQSKGSQHTREETYMMIRIIGRLISSSQYIFLGEEEKKGFRTISLNFITRLLKETKNPDSYLILCITKINIKYMSVENDDELFEGKKEYFQALAEFILSSIRVCQGKIEDGDKHPYRQIFELLTAYVNISANTSLEFQSKVLAQQSLNILLKERMVDNLGNQRMMKEFENCNPQEVDCFKEIFARVPEMFKINLPTNLGILNQLNLDALNSDSLTFWLHLTSLLLPEHDASIEQTQLILKFLNSAIQARSIASLHYIENLVKEILFELQDGISTTYLWKFIEEQRSIKFQEFLVEIIKYSMQILTIPNYTLIENCLHLFKTMFSRLCRFKHQSFAQYFQIIEQVCMDINRTMLSRPEYTRLRIGFFTIISIIWVNEGQLSLVYKVFNNVRESVNVQPDLIGFMRYMTDITGILEPVETSEIYKILVELILRDMNNLLPHFFSDPTKLAIAFSDETFLKVFFRFVNTIISDSNYRMTEDVHTELPFKIEEAFRPYLMESIKYDYPKRTIETWMKFLKLNPLSPLLPLDPNFRLKDPQLYKTLLREYFENLHRLSTLEEFYNIYEFIDGNIELMMDWWEEVMARGLKPNIPIQEVAKSHIWNNNRQKELLARLLYRTANYDPTYWTVPDGVSESAYSEWFIVNFQV